MLRPNNRPAADGISTGAPGLDDVLQGGFPKGHTYLVSGDPGSGKTTLALQFLIEGAKQGERVLYVTLSESEKELRHVAKSHAFDLTGVDIYELLPLEESLREEEQYTLLYPAEVELADTLNSILKRVDEIQPQRVVFDSLSELRLLARDSLRYRRQVLALKQFFSGRNCTVLMLDDRTGNREDRDLQSISHGVISLENLLRDYGTQRRRLQVVKLRGVAYREGFHDYNIKTGGLQVYPRLIATDHRRDRSTDLVSSGLPELDALLGGGLNRGTSTLVLGPAGAGKSTISLCYAAAAAARGEFAAFYTFDEAMPTLLRRSEGLGIPIERLLDEQKLLLEVVDPAELCPGDFVTRVCDAVERLGARVIVIDSLNGLLAAMPDERNLMIQLHELVSFLNLKGVTTFLILAQYGILGQHMQTPLDASYLADAILLLRYFESRGQVRQAISAVKKRSGKHERTIRELELGPQLVRVGAPLTEFHGVLSGIPSFVGQQDQLGSNSGKVWTQDGQADDTRA